jgi:gamma-glutamylputrescine oxidase
MTLIANERLVLADSLWAATANPAPDRPALNGQVAADCVIIGGGFTGLSAALHLVQAGLNFVPFSGHFAY